MATSLWSSIIISFIVGLLASSAIHSSMRANLFATSPDCVAECIRQNVTNMSAFTASLEKTASGSSAISVRYLIDAGRMKMTSLGRDVGSYLTSIDYTGNLQYGCHTVVKYMAKFDAIGSTEHHHLSLMSLRQTVLFIYNSIPDQAIPTYTGNLQYGCHTVVKYMAKFDAIGSMEHHRLSLMWLRQTVLFIYNSIPDQANPTYTGNLQYGFHTVVKYMAKFDAIGSTEHHRISLMWLRHMVMFIYNCIPDHATSALGKVFNIPGDVYRAIPDRLELGQMAHNATWTYIGNQYGCHTVVKYLAKFDAIGSMQHHQLSLNALRYMAMIIHNSLPDQMVYNATWNYTGNIEYGCHTVVKYMAMFDAIGSMENHQLSVMSLKSSLWSVYDILWNVYKALPDCLVLGQMAHNATRIDYSAAILRMVTNGVTAMQDSITILSVAVKDLMAKIAACDSKVEVCALVCGLLCVATVSFKLLKGPYRKFRDGINGWRQCQKLSLVKAERGRKRKKRQYRCRIEY